jgi:hypothetical protein
MAAGYRKLGPGLSLCLVCGARISTNALARAGHERGEAHKSAAAGKLGGATSGTVSDGFDARASCGVKRAK